MSLLCYNAKTMEILFEDKDVVVINKPAGIMILCKRKESHAHIKEQFKNRTTKKTYHALVYGQMKQDEIMVDAAIGRSKTFAKWTAISKAMRGTAREAQTAIKVLDRFEGFSYVEAKPRTGRTHQIRVHLQYLNYPILADSIYAGKRYDPNRPGDSLGFVRQALHAHKIIFTSLDDKEIEVIAPLPTDFENALSRD